MKCRVAFSLKLFVSVFFVLILLAPVACARDSGGNPNGTQSNTVTMGAVDFGTTSITIPKGSTITFTTAQNGTAHSLVIGNTGKAQSEQGAPDFGAGPQTIPAGQSWTTPPWNTAGTFHITCTLHPTTMNMTVVVTS